MSGELLSAWVKGEEGDANVRRRLFLLLRQTLTIRRPCTRRALSCEDAQSRRDAASEAVSVLSKEALVGRSEAACMVVHVLLLVLLVLISTHGDVDP